MLDEYFQKEKQLKNWPKITSAQADGNYKLIYRLQLPNGNISPEQALELAEGILFYVLGDAWERECTEDDRNKFYSLYDEINKHIL